MKKKRLIITMRINGTDWLTLSTIKVPKKGKSIVITLPILTANHEIVDIIVSGEDKSQLPHE